MEQCLGNICPLWGDFGSDYGFFKAEKREVVGGIFWGICAWRLYRALHSTGLYRVPQGSTLFRALQDYYRAAQGLEPSYRLLVAVAH